MSAQSSCTVDGCVCMEREGLLAEIEATSELLEIRTDPWLKVAGAFGVLNFVLLVLMALAK